MYILIGLAIFGFGVYLNRKVILPDKIGFHKFNYGHKIKRNAFIYALLMVGAIMVLRELVIWIWL